MSGKKSAILLPPRPPPSRKILKTTPKPPPRIADRGHPCTHIMTKLCNQMNDLKESLKKVKSFNCDECAAFNQVQFIDTYTKCEECNQLFCKFN